MLLMDRILGNKRYLWKTLQKTLNLFFVVSFDYISKRFNRAPHHLAKYSSEQDYYFEWIESLPFWLNGLDSLLQVV